MGKKHTVMEFYFNFFFISFLNNAEVLAENELV